VADGDVGPDAEALLAIVRARLADDLDAPGALAAVDAWVADAEAAASEPVEGSPGASELVEGSPRLVRDLVDALLGVQL
jgi:L-cysteine:1D-myo-inositol 2-amino-2-deoxy-alpha-D-glucopyranoside ligase